MDVPSSFSRRAAAMRFVAADRWATLAFRCVLLAIDQPGFPERWFPGN